MPNTIQPGEYSTDGGEDGFIYENGRVLGSVFCPRAAGF